jgi:hypothetical protein
MPKSGEMRPATGAVQIGDDWPGIFIRGDEALAYASKLKFLISTLEARVHQLSEAEVAAWARVQELADLLESCRVTRPEPRANSAKSH